MEYTLKLYITDNFGRPYVRIYNTMAENIDDAYEKVMNMFYAEQPDNKSAYKIWRYEIK